MAKAAAARLTYVVAAGELFVLVEGLSSCLSLQPQLQIVVWHSQNRIDLQRRNFFACARAIRLARLPAMQLPILSSDVMMIAPALI